MIAAIFVGAALLSGGDCEFEIEDVGGWWGYPVYYEPVYYDPYYYYGPCCW